MTVLLSIILFTALGGVLSVLAAAVFLLLPEHKQKHVLPHGISFAIGALLTGAFCGLIPHAFEEVPVEDMSALSATILAGILLFFVLEKLLVWRHCHSHACEAHGEESHEDHHHEHGHTHAIQAAGHRPAGMFIILGDSIHNFVDGVLIGAAFLTDVQLGIVTSLAVAAHEIPQEVGDFAILLHSGYKRGEALFYNILASLSTVVGGVLAYFSLGDLHHILPYFLTLAASSFIYIAVADLIPSLHQKTDIKTSLQQIGFILAGVVLILVMQGIAHRFEGKIDGDRVEQTGIV
ncbi:ZIP family metal transporter [Methylomonas sp. BW4-1]|uniref:ZIP family metal transporter n=1 Tax=Methylomonas defluvii TaxID=3045149 RepID=A0ABU4UGN9_9GAMM|nr:MULTISPECIES: ZIP family metal transporter [unclassified Methylomonas]MDX8127874.1 ZIP family metal transporter [Methylomonas sp. OY6]NOV32070.1 ZIP family metal transporter [Methylomonas sp. ZR1]PKD40146.1 ZIP zinc transporter [Methylomonas sp. Kb3]